MGSWIFTVIIWILMFIALLVDSLKIKIALVILQIIIFIIQIIYVILKFKSWGRKKENANSIFDIVFISNSFLYDKFWKTYKGVQATGKEIRWFELWKFESKDNEHVNYWLGIRV